MKNKPLKIYVLGSNSFVHQMVESKDRLCELGFEGSIHPHYEAHVKGNIQAFPDLENKDPREPADFKRSHDYIRQHYASILENDAILIVNQEKKGKKNYIGGNCLMEMGMAYVNDKKIFLTNDIPVDSAYVDEILAMDPICLKGDLKNIEKYV